VVVVESEQTRKTRQFVERLGPKLIAAKIRLAVRPGERNGRDQSFSRRFFLR